MKKLMLIALLGVIVGNAWGAAKQDPELREMIAQRVSNAGIFGRARDSRSIDVATKLQALRDLQLAVDADDLVAAKWVSTSLKAFDDNGKFNPVNRQKSIDDLIKLGFPGAKLR